MAGAGENVGKYWRDNRYVDQSILGRASTLETRVDTLESQLGLLQEKLLQLEEDQGKRRPMRIPSTVDKWSTIFLEGEVQQTDYMSLFDYALSWPVPGTDLASTKADTNIREGGRMSSGYAYGCTGMTCSLWGAREEVEALVPHLTFSLEFYQTSHPLAPLDTWNYMSADDEGIQRWQLRAERSDSSPWLIPSNTSFYVTASVGRVPIVFKHGVRLKLTLHGDLIPGLRFG